MREFTGKMPQTKIADQTFRERAQHRSHFLREFLGKMPGPTIATHTLCKPAQSK